MIDSFAQTEIHNLVLLEAATGGGISSSDMVDSGVDSQHKGDSQFLKERNISLTEDDEALSFSEYKYREEDEIDGQKAVAADDDKKDDQDEVSYWCRIDNS